MADGTAKGDNQRRRRIEIRLRKSTQQADVADTLSIPICLQRSTPVTEIATKLQLHTGAVLRHLAISLLGLAAASGGTTGAAAQTPTEATVEEVVVTSRAQRLYRVETTTVGKMAADPLDIPQSVQVINAELMQDLGARDVTDLYRNISGVSFFSYAGVTFRGFRQDQQYFDGLRGDQFIGFSVPQLFNIARVEVLKGPAGMLYGPAPPGGTINYVTKTPQRIFSGELAAVAGNYDRVGASGEVTGPLPGVDRLYGRLGLFYEDRDSFRVGASNTSKIGDVGLTAELTRDLELIVQATSYEQDLPGNRLRGVQVNENGDFLTSRSWNHNEPTDFLTSKAQVYQARLNWDPVGPVAGIFQARTFEAKEGQEYHEPRDRLDTDGDGVIDTISREFRDQRRWAEGTAFGGNLTADGAALGVNHRILAGGDWYEEESLSLSRTAVARTRGGIVPDLSLVNPIYGTTRGDNYGLDAVPYRESASRSRRWGVYLQDQVLIGERFIAIGGVRYDRHEDENLMNGESYEDDAVTWRAGLIYKPIESVSVYGSWSDSFEPHGAGTQDPAVGGPFDPVRGTQIEGGVKTALMDGRLQASAAVYRIVRRNMVQTDTTRPPVNGRDQLAPIGEVTSKGFEFDLAADVTPNWVVTANYGYNDTKVTDTIPGQSITNAVGDRFVNAPKHKLGFWTRYQVDAINTAFAFGGEYVSERVGFDEERVKPYTIFDASIITDLEFAEVMLRVENLFDKKYAASGFGLRGGSFPGAPRTWFVEVRREF